MKTSLKFIKKNVIQDPHASGVPNTFHYTRWIAQICIWRAPLLGCVSRRTCLVEFWMKTAPLWNIKAICFSSGDKYKADIGFRFSGATSYPCAPDNKYWPLTPRYAVAMIMKHRSNLLSTHSKISYYATWTRSQCGVVISTKSNLNTQSKYFE